MRTAVMLGLGFLAVFLVSLIAAPGSEGPRRSTTRSCGPYVAAGPRSRRYVAYATETDCLRARAIALAYTARNICPRRSECKTMIDGLHCRTAGSAGRRLVWMRCGQGKNIHKPRVFFSVGQSGPAATEAPVAPALPS